MSVPKVFYGAFQIPDGVPGVPARRTGETPVTPLLINAKPRFLLRSRNNPLRRGAKIAIRTERAMILRIRSKLPPRDSVCHLLHPQLGFFQLRVRPRGADSRVVFEVIEDKP